MPHEIIAHTKIMDIMDFGAISILFSCNATNLMEMS